MEIGRLRTRVTLKQPSRSQENTYGGEQVTWSDVDTAWARVENLRGRDLDHARQVYQDVTVRVTMRHRSDVTAGWRLVTEGGRTLEVLAAYDPEEGRGRALECLCREVT